MADEVGDVVLLHHAIRHYLGTESYHLTDFSKGAMLTAHANIDRTERYDRWYRLRLAELDLVGPEAQIFAVGKVVARDLRRRGFRKFTEILHYSGLAGRARAAAIHGHETEFEAFRGTVSLEDVLATAEKVLEPVPAWLRDTTLGALARTELTTSKKRLLFAYRLAVRSPASCPSWELGLSRLRRSCELTIASAEAAAFRLRSHRREGVGKFGRSMDPGSAVRRNRSAAE